jgi:hypothetical protein
MFQYPKKKSRHPNLPDSHHSALYRKDAEHCIALEHYVAKQYRATHQARRTSFPPHLLSMSLDGELQAVAGLKPVNSGKICSRLTGVLDETKSTAISLRQLTNYIHRKMHTLQRKSLNDILSTITR